MRRRTLSQDHNTTSHRALDPLHSHCRPEAALYKQYSCAWAGLTSHQLPLCALMGIPRVRSEETGLSRQHWVPSSTSCYHTCHNHPGGTDHQSPGLCLRQDPFHSPVQASAAGRSPSIKHCSQWGHLTPDTPSVSREVTRAPSNPPQLNLSPETSSPSTPLAVNSHQQHGHASPATQAPRRRARPRLMPALLACLPEHCGDITPLPRQAGRKLAKRALEMAPEEQVELGHPHRAAAPTCDSPVPQRRAQRQGCEQQGHSRGCHLLQVCSSSIKDPVTQGTAGLQCANSQKGLRAELRHLAGPLHTKNFFLLPPSRSQLAMKVQAGVCGIPWFIRGSPQDHVEVCSLEQSKA